MASATDVVLPCILAYHATVCRAVEFLVRVTGRFDPLTARRCGAFPRRGAFAGVRYGFHGIGCVVELGEVTVDFDWTHSGRHGGFDGWRVAQFSEQFPDVLSVEEVERALVELVALEVVEPPLPNEHLFHLRLAHGSMDDALHVLRRELVVAETHAASVGAVARLVRQRCEEALGSVGDVRQRLVHSVVEDAECLAEEAPRVLSAELLAALRAGRTGGVR